MQGVPAITVQQLAEALASPEPPQLLDVREAAEIAQSALPDIIHIPLMELPDNLHRLNPEVPIAVICHSGGRSAHATAFLLQEGFTAANVAGGMVAWMEEMAPFHPRS